MDQWTFLMMQAFEAKSFLELAENTHRIGPKSSMEELLTQLALFKAFLLSYGKCFASAGKGRRKLEAKHVFGDRDDLLPIHRRIMELRNTFAAHNDTSGLDEAVIDIEETKEELILSHRYAFAIPLNEYEKYKKCTAVLEEYLIDKTNKTMDSLQKQLGKTIKMKQG
ncbi:hypothetical protein NM74_18000 [Aeromonas hydrophila]|nr:hypothetical protein NM74_18000 [Aeromonas hydrophila]